jgi:DNA polymerase-3 subunit delta'
MPFSDIIGQDNTVAWLQRAIVEGTVGHALLFYGPEGCGKKVTAMSFAKALNCLDEEHQAKGDFCDVCRACNLINRGNHPDVRLFTPATTGGKTVIPIDAIRTKSGESPTHPLPLREDAQLKPMEGRTKVYVLDPANRPGLQEDAGNSLLLTLEEPPNHVVIILISSRPNSVLPTLVSRCRPVRFNLSPRDAVRSALAKNAPEIDDITAEAITGMAAGRVGWAIAVAQNPAVLKTRKELMDAIMSYLPRGRRSALKLAKIMHDLSSAAEILIEPGEEEKGSKKGPTDDQIRRRNMPELLDIVAACWRDLMICTMGEPTILLNTDYEEQIRGITGKISLTDLRTGLHEIMRTKLHIERNANIDLSLERLWMTILCVK